MNAYNVHAMTDDDITARLDELREARLQHAQARLRAQREHNKGLAILEANALKAATHEYNVLVRTLARRMRDA